jgi:DNA-binding transcriptional regulator YiaG
MTAQQITSLREFLKLDQGQFAALIGVSRETVNRWERGLHPPRGLSLKVLTELAAKKNKLRAARKQHF